MTFQTAAVFTEDPAGVFRRPCSACGVDARFRRAHESQALSLCEACAIDLGWKDGDIMTSLIVGDDEARRLAARETPLELAKSVLYERRRAEAWRRAHDRVSARPWCPLCNPGTAEQIRGMESASAAAYTPFRDDEAAIEVQDWVRDVYGIPEQWTERP